MIKQSNIKLNGQLTTIRYFNIGVCPSKWLHIQDSCFKISTNSLNWNAAKSACETLGSKLAMIKSQAVQQALAPKISTHTWIGLHRDPKDNSRWLWVDGTKPTYTNWDRGEPNNAGQNEACGYMRPGSGWNDAHCTYSTRYICEIAGK